jgi:hypothetical protein
MCQYVVHPTFPKTKVSFRRIKKNAVLAESGRQRVGELSSIGQTAWCAVSRMAPCGFFLARQRA